MCLALLAWRAHPDYRLIVAANRDEYYVRRSSALGPWPEIPGLIAARDLDSGDQRSGLWLGLRTRGARRRFATLTNVAGPDLPHSRTISRGLLPRAFLTDEEVAPQIFASAALRTSAPHAGFNLAVSDLDQLWWCSNRASGRAERLLAGTFALTNDARLHTASEPIPPAPLVQRLWHRKAQRAITAFREVIDEDAGDVESYFDVLSDRTPIDDASECGRGLPPTVSRMYSARFVANSLYGTRSSTVVVVREDGSWRMVERTFGQHGKPLSCSAFDGPLTLTGVGLE